MMRYKLKTVTLIQNVPHGQNGLSLPIVQKNAEAVSNYVRVIVYTHQITNVRKFSRTRNSFQKMFVIHKSAPRGHPGRYTPNVLEHVAMGSNSEAEIVCTATLTSVLVMLSRVAFVIIRNVHGCQIGRIGRRVR